MPRATDNLVWRAADGSLARRRAEAAAPSGVRVRIDKRIPIAAGLGGGSSDAAAALRALARLWRIRLDEQGVADGLRPRSAPTSPSFWRAERSAASAAATCCRRLPTARAAGSVVATPPFGVPTADAYRWFDQDADDEGP